MDEAVASSRICRLIEREPPRWMLLALLGLAIFVRGRVMSSADTNGLWTDPDGYAAVAKKLVEYGSFAAVATDDRPVLTAARPLLYPLVLAGLLWIDDGTMPIAILHVLLGVGTVVAVYYLGRLWSVPPGACLVAALLVTVDPILVAHADKIMTETLATFLATCGLIALSRAAGRDSLTWGLAAGIAGGLAILCRPEFLVWIATALVLFPWMAQGPRRWSRLAVCGVAVVAVLAPWTIRNQRAFGAPVFLTTHGGFTLMLANNPSFYEYLRSAPWGSVWDGRDAYRQYARIAMRKIHVQYPTPDKQVRQVVVDEVAIDRAAYRQAFENIRAEPAMFLWSCVVRVGRLWNVLPHQTSPDESPSRRGLRWAVAVWYSFELALAAVGAWILRRKLFAHPWLWGLLLVLSITLVHAFYWTDMRMRAPLSGVVALAAATGLASLACGRRGASALNPAS